jgi:hypothetical protein
MGATGTYSGSLFGSVDNNGARYLASGGLRATYHFGMQQGTFSIINYDGRFTFTAMGKAQLVGANYQFGFSRPQNLPLQGGASGTFYGPGAVETGGNFAFSTFANKIGVPFPYFTSGIYGASLVGR